MSQSLSGLFAAVITPVLDNGDVDLKLLASHCAALLEKGCHGVSLFGTTGEGPAFTAHERMAGLEAVLANGVAPSSILPATGSAALPETVALTRHALKNGCNNVLVMPPFFFKGLSDDNVVAIFSKIIDDVADSKLKVYLYNFPAVTGVEITPDAIGRLVEAYPDTIAGVKDSSGDWDYVTAIRQRFPDLALFTGWETKLPMLLADGGAGNISGLANVIPDVLRVLFDRRPTDASDPVLMGVAKLVEAATSVPTTPAIKAIAADLQGKASWHNIRPPLLPLTSEQDRDVLQAYKQAMDTTGLK